jgi:WD40 repeat protein
MLLYKGAKAEESFFSFLFVLQYSYLLMLTPNIGYLMDNENHPILNILGTLISSIIFIVIGYLWLRSNDPRIEAVLLILGAFFALIGLLVFLIVKMFQAYKMNKKPKTIVVNSPEPLKISSFKKPQLSCQSQNTITTPQPSAIAILHYLSPTKLLFGHFNTTLALWDKDANSFLPPQPMKPDFQTELYPVKAIASTKDGRYIVYTLWGSEFRVMDWSLNDYGTYRKAESPTAMAFSPDSQWLIIGFGNGGEIQLWSVQEGTPGPIVSPGYGRGHLKAHDAKVEAVRFHPTQPFFATISINETTIRLWSIENDEMVAKGEKVISRDIVGKDLTFKYLEFSPDGKLLAVGCSNGGFLIWDMSSKAAPYVDRDAVSALSFSPDSRFLAVAEGEWLRIYPIDSGSPSSTVENKKFDKPIQSIAFSPDGNTLAVVKSGDMTVQLCDVKEG